MVLLAALALSLTSAACGGGGGRGPSGSPGAPWPQFRHDSGRTGGSSGIIVSNRGLIRFVAVDPEAPLSPVSSSPIIDADGTVYIASEGGTLRAVRRGDLETKWLVQECAACCPDGAGAACDPRLGPFVASPALLRFRDETNLLIADTNGRVYRFTVDESAREPVPACNACFVPDLSGDASPAATVAIRSSALLTANVAVGGLASAVVGAQIDDGGSRGGKLYSINADGSLRWQFPRRGQGFIGPVTSSPALGVGGSIIVTAGDDSLYIVSRDGELRRQISIAELSEPDAFLHPSVVSSLSLFVGSARGEIYAFNHDGTFRWSTRFPGRRFSSSLTIGAQVEPTPEPDDGSTPTPTRTLAPGEPSPSPTPTSTPATLFSTVMGVSDEGELVFLEAPTGEPMPPSGMSAQLPPDARIVSSPAVSLDGFLVFADTAGQVHVMDTWSGRAPRFCVRASSVLCERDENCGVDDVCGAPYWPMSLPARCADGTATGLPCDDDDDCPDSICTPAGIRSSPALDGNGAIYVGADDGFLYAIGAQTPTPTPTIAATPTVAP